MDDNPQTTSNDPLSGSAATATPQAAPMTPPTATPMAPYPRAGVVSQEEKSQATLVWVLSIFFGFIPSLIFYLIAKDKPFVHRHSAMALALTIITAIGYIASSFLMVILVGLLLLPVVGIFHLVICIMGAMAANKSEEYNPPIAAGLAKSMFGIS